MDPPIRPDHLGEPVHIGGFQLGQLPVLQDGLDDRMLAPQLLQHVGVGGVASLGLFHRGQSQLVKEDAAQLLGGVDVELLPRQRKDGCLGPLYPLGEHLSEADQRPPVHQHPFPLHLRQHWAEGQLDLLVQRPQVQLLQPLSQRLVEGPDKGAVGYQGAHWGRRVGQGAEGPLLQIGGGLGELLVVVGHPQLLQLVAAVSRGQEIGRHFGVKDEVPGLDPLVQQGFPKLLDPMGRLADAWGEELPQELVVAVQPAGEKQRRPGEALTLLPLHAHGVQPGQSQHIHLVQPPPQGKQLLHPLPALHHLALTGSGDRGRLCIPLSLGCGESVFIDELGKLQPEEELVQGGPVRLPAQVCLRCELDGSVGADGGQIIGHAGHLLPLGQLFDHSRLGWGVSGHLDLRHGRVQQVDGSIPLDQGHGRLLPHPFHPGDVVAGIPHEGFQIDNVDGPEAVLLLKGLRGHIPGGGTAHAGGHQLDGGGLCHQLEGVLVPCDHHGLPPGGSILHRDGADEVVRLPSVQLVHGDVQGREDLLQDGHLTGQLVGHPLAGGLIALIGQMAEGGGLPVKGDTQCLRFALVQQLVQDGQKAEHRIGGLAVPGGQVLAHAVKGPIDNGIPIQDHQFFHRVCPPVSGPQPEE